MINLPLSWCLTPIERIIESLNYGTSKKCSYDTNGVPVLRIPNVGNGIIEHSDLKYTDLTEKEFEQLRLIPGDILVIRSNGSVSLVGKSAVVRESERDFAYAGYLIRLRPNNLLLDSNYLNLCLSSHKVRLQIEVPAKSTSGVHNINSQELKQITVPLPPLNEQRRIVVKIEASKARSQRVKEELEAIPAFLDQFRQSVLAAAFRGDLTADWREKNPDVEPASELLKRIQKEREERYEQACIKAKKEGKQKPRKIFPHEIPLLEDECLYDLPESWAITNINFLAHVTKLAGFEYTKYIKLEDFGEIPVVRAQNVQMGKFVKENIKYISKETSDLLERSQLHGREILMVFIGAGTGNVCLAPQERRWHLAPNVAKIDIDGIFNKYLLFYLQSPIGKRTTLSWAKATAQPSLSMETIRKISVYVPPLAEQQEIVRCIESLLQVANQVEQQYKQAKAHLAQLDRSILAKAFRGELVPQDPNDEPASVLLERIRAEREKLDTKKKAKGKTEKKSRKAKPEPAEPEQLSLPGFE